MYFFIKMTCTVVYITLSFRTKQLVTKIFFKDLWTQQVFSHFHLPEESVQSFLTL